MEISVFSLALQRGRATCCRSRSQSPSAGRSRQAWGDPEKEERSKIKADRVDTRIYLEFGSTD